MSITVGKTQAFASSNFNVHISKTEAEAGKEAVYWRNIDSTLPTNRFHVVISELSSRNSNDGPVHVIYGNIVGRSKNTLSEQTTFRVKEGSWKNGIFYVVELYKTKGPVNFDGYNFQNIPSAKKVNAKINGNLEGRVKLQLKK